MKYALTLLSLLCLTSCKYFEVKKTTPEAILNEELKTFDWNDVDTYPSFSVCDSVMSKNDKKNCFEYHLSSYILKSLESEFIVVTQDIHDTLELHFNVSEKGDLALINTKVDSLTLLEIPDLHKLIRESLDSLPEIFPANKLSIPVKTKFKLPIVINVE